HGAFWIAVAAEWKVGRQTDRLSGLCEDGDHAERAWSRLRLPLVAQYAGQAVSGLADDHLRGTGPGRQRDSYRHRARSARCLEVERAVGGRFQTHSRFPDELSDVSQSVPATRSRNGVSASTVVLSLLCLMYFINYVVRVNVNTAALVFKDELHLSNKQVGLIFSMFAFPYLVFQFIGGLGRDRWGGPKTVATVCLVLLPGPLCVCVARDPLRS